VQSLEAYFVDQPSLAKLSFEAVVLQEYKKKLSLEELSLNWHERPLKKVQTHHCALFPVVILNLFTVIIERLDLIISCEKLSHVPKPHKV
jgi:hypothetical protein